MAFTFSTRGEQAHEAGSLGDSEDHSWVIFGETLLTLRCENDDRASLLQALRPGCEVELYSSVTLADSSASRAAGGHRTADAEHHSRGV